MVRGLFFGMLAFFVVVIADIAWLMYDVPRPAGHFGSRHQAKQPPEA
jgi:hypothetical protein